MPSRKKLPYNHLLFQELRTNTSLMYMWRHLALLWWRSQLPSQNYSTLAFLRMSLCCLAFTKVLLEPDLIPTVWAAKIYLKLCVPPFLNSSQRQGIIGKEKGSPKQVELKICLLQPEPVAYHHTSIRYLCWRLIY